MHLILLLLRALCSRAIVSPLQILQISLKLRHYQPSVSSLHPLSNVQQYSPRPHTPVVYLFMDSLTGISYFTPNSLVEGNFLAKDITGWFLSTIMREECGHITFLFAAEIRAEIEHKPLVPLVSDPLHKNHSN